MSVSFYIQIAANYLHNVVVDSWNNFSLDDRFDREFSIEFRICLVIEL